MEDITLPKKEIINLRLNEVECPQGTEEIVGFVPEPTEGGSQIPDMKENSLCHSTMIILLDFRWAWEWAVSSSLWLRDCSTGGLFFYVEGARVSKGQDFQNGYNEVTLNKCSEKH